MQSHTSFPCINIFSLSSSLIAHPDSTLTLFDPPLSLTRNTAAAIPYPLIAAIVHTNTHVALA